VSEAEARQIARDSRYGCHPEHGCISTSRETPEENILRNREYFAQGLFDIQEFELRVDLILKDAIYTSEWQ
jgi:hypothetical protein